MKWKKAPYALSCLAAKLFSSHLAARLYSSSAGGVLAPGISRILARSGADVDDEVWKNSLVHVYQTLADSSLIHFDEVQKHTAEKLDSGIHRTALVRKDKLDIPGIYLYGEVGTGKSMLVDILSKSLEAQHHRVLRSHFHAFMLSVHEKLRHAREYLAAQQQSARVGEQHASKVVETGERSSRHAATPSYSSPSPSLEQRTSSRADAILAAQASLPSTSATMEYVVSTFRSNHDIVILDEFQVTDIADAMILERLFNSFIEHKIPIITTSNRPPSDLYQHGLNRHHFLPFINKLSSTFEVVQMKGKDYRQVVGGASRKAEKTGSGVSAEWEGMGSFFDQKDDFWRVASRVFGQDMAKVERGQSEVRQHGATARKNDSNKALIDVGGGRSIKADVIADRTVLLSFDELCNRPIGAADYRRISSRFDVVFVYGVPQLSVRQHNETRRFITFVDIMYDSGKDLVVGADVPRHQLLNKLKVKYDRVRDEMYAEFDVEKNEGGGGGGDEEEALVGNERLGVSMGGVSGLSDISFAFKRTLSRLEEMDRPISKVLSKCK